MTAVTWLFAPGDRPERFSKAAASVADEVIIDLEDAVAPDRKEHARAATADWVRAHPAWVRTNAVGTPWYEADLEVLAGAAGLRGVVVPKAEEPSSLQQAGDRLDSPLVALIETARGLAEARRIGHTAAVARLAFGTIDFALDMDATENRESLLFARSELVLASRLAGLPAPLDGVTAQLDDPSIAAADARYARGLGFGGKLCIHPAQLAPVAEVFVPTVLEVEWATGVLSTPDGGARRSGDVMVDEPIIRRAERIMAAHAAAGRPAEK